MYNCITKETYKSALNWSNYWKTYVLFETDHIPSVQIKKEVFTWNSYFQPSLLGTCSIALKSVLKSDALFVNPDLAVRDKPQDTASSTSHSKQAKGRRSVVGHLKVCYSLTTPSLSVCLCVSMCLSLSVCLSVCLSVSVSVSVSFCLSVSVSVSLSISVSFSLSLSVCLPVCLSASLSLSLSLSVCVCVCVWERKKRGRNGCYRTPAFDGLMVFTIDNLFTFSSNRWQQVGVNFIMSDIMSFSYDYSPDLCGAGLW